MRRMCRRILARAPRRRRPKFRQCKPSRPTIVSVHLRGNGATCLVPETFHSLVDVVRGISRPVRRPTRERGTRRRRQLQLDLPRAVAAGLITHRVRAPARGSRRIPRGRFQTVRAGRVVAVGAASTNKRRAPRAWSTRSSRRRARLRRRHHTGHSGRLRPIGKLLCLSRRSESTQCGRAAKL